MSELGETFSIPLSAMPSGCIAPAQDETLPGECSLALSWELRQPGRARCPHRAVGQVSENPLLITLAPIGGEGWGEGAAGDRDISGKHPPQASDRHGDHEPILRNPLTHPLLPLSPIGGEGRGEGAIGGEDALFHGDSDPLPAWYCVHARPKHEHIAAAHLRSLEEVDVFSPRIRFKRSTRQGPAWVTEAMFPGYLFARFNWRGWLGRVRSATGVSGVVHFGHHWPTIPEPVIDDLRQAVGQDDLCVLPTALNPGDEVEISGGVFHGLRAVVTSLLPARQRVKVLLDFLGQPTWAELSENAVIKRNTHPPLD